MMNFEIRLFLPEKSGPGRLLHFAVTLVFWMVQFGDFFTDITAIQISR